MYKIKSILKHGEKNYAQELENSINVYSTSGQKNTLRFILALLSKCPAWAESYGVKLEIEIGGKQVRIVES